MQLHVQRRSRVATVSRAAEKDGRKFLGHALGDLVVEPKHAVAQRDVLHLFCPTRLVVESPDLRGAPLSRIQGLADRAETEAGASAIVGDQGHALQARIRPCSLEFLWDDGLMSCGFDLQSRSRCSPGAGSRDPSACIANHSGCSFRKRSQASAGMIEPLPGRNPRCRPCCHEPIRRGDPAHPVPRRLVDLQLIQTHLIRHDILGNRISRTIRHRIEAPIEIRHAHLRHAASRIWTGGPQNRHPSTSSNGVVTS